MNMNNPNEHMSNHPADDAPWSAYLSRDEAVQLARQFRTQDGKRGFTQAEMDLVWKWAEETRVRSTFLELVLAGHVEISLSGSEIVFRALPGREHLLEGIEADSD